MFIFILKRLLMGACVAITVSIAAFLLLNLSADPAAMIAGEDADRQTIEELRAQYQLDRPLYIRYGVWIGGVVQGDFGNSYYWKKPVLDLFIERAPVTLTLGFSALFIAIVVGLILGVLAALKPNGWLDRFALSFGTAAQAVPNFWLGLMFIIFFGVMFPIFPVSGDTTWKHFVMPSIVLGMSSVPQILRLTRAGMIDVLASDYIRTARAKGFRSPDILLKHALRNALLPVVSVIAIQFGYKFAGSVITESVFALNGIGRLAYQSILGADIPTVQMLVFLFAIIFILMTILGEILNAWLDPRIRVE
ncbi:ABC transporter permease [Marinomonas sp. MED121]|uniref:ABC transporter permease n=1 Tax=Marinomonas sp. MED121 TaxID=314277 RepID=UPI000E2F217E|nr:ABC transporter permease [Marinomonas sp. MED121]